VAGDACVPSDPSGRGGAASSGLDCGYFREAWGWDCAFTANPGRLPNPEQPIVGGGAANYDVNDTRSRTFRCSKSATQAMAAVRNDVGQFADNAGTVFAANFLTSPSPRVAGI